MKSLRFAFFLPALFAASAFHFSAFAATAAQPIGAPIIPLDELKPGQRGEVWTVFRGAEPEPFAVEVTGILRNALGPGKSLIVCQLTDDRVQKMGAVAGMSGSPLYVEGRFAGALSYQIQRFETVRHAGFTPAADLDEVNNRPATRRDPGAASPPAQSLSATPDSLLSPKLGEGGSFRALQPVFALGGLSPAVADLFAPQFSALGLNATALGGYTPAAAASSSLNSQPSALNSPALRPGSAVSVALATGDITLAGTGTVSRLDGARLTAFGHPMMTLGEVALPMCAAEILTILPSQMQSVKLANTGAVIGTITQDRLSAISGTLGAGPEMTAVEVTVNPLAGAPRTLKFSVVRHQQVTPMIMATGVAQAILGSNDAGLSNGFRLTSNIRFAPAAQLGFETLYAGPQGFTQGLNEFVQGLAANLQNPYAKTFPERVTFTIEPLESNPTVTLDLFQLSRTTAAPGQTVQATLAWRDWQGEARREIIDLAVDPKWAGRQLEVILAPGRALDQLTGRPRTIAAAELRSFDAYLAAMRDDRPGDGVFVAVVERASLFTDQTVATPEAPGSIERIARGADEARFRRREAVLPLWEKHLQPGKLFNTIVRRPLVVTE